jgi:hypothetical protein
MHSTREAIKYDSHDYNHDLMAQTGLRYFQDLISMFNMFLSTPFFMIDMKPWHRYVEMVNVIVCHQWLLVEVFHCKSFFQAQQ